jgi:hypothetical protein
VVAAAALAAYAPAMRNLYTLDDRLVFETRADRAEAPFTTLLDHGYFARYNQDSYRPVATFTSMVDHRLGVDPIRAGHAQNIVWHAGTAALVTVFAGRFLPPVAAMFAGMIFAVHPAASEATLGIGYREDTIVAFFVMAALLLTLRGGRTARLLGLAAYTLALFAKENAVVFPGLLVLTRLTVERSRPLQRRAFAREIAGVLLVTACYLVVRFGTMAPPDSFADPAGGTYARTLVAAPRVFAHYVRMLVAPWPLVVLYAHMFPVGASLTSQLPWLAFDAGLVAGATWLARTRPTVGFGLLWFVVALAPVMHIVPMRVFAADRFVHLSLVGGAIAAGALVAAFDAPARPALVRHAAQGCGVAVVLALLLFTRHRIPAWHDEVTLWRDTLRHNPRAYIGHFVVGNDLASRGLPAQARRQLEAAVADCPRESEFGRAHFCAPFAASLGFARLGSGETPAAMQSFADALGFVHDYVPAIVGLGQVRLMQGDLRGARRHAELATMLDPVAPPIRALLEQFRVLIRRAEAQSPGERGDPTPL